ncbi:MAG: foldase protein PrsA [Thermoleophilaceae bacterium]|jgi:foldase protein PrsA|nr:foldase protein PrsA [Thermoleophilaceae bacterium]MEA2438505.1 foldase protein PrsA [Thermoleophilaceae bacterium]
MPKTFRLLLVLALMAAVLVAAGCGGSDVPSDSVAKVGDVKITKSQFNHWFLASVKQQAQSTGQKPDQVVAPDPPNFTKCIAAKQKQPLPAGVPKPDAKALKAQCKQEYDGVSQQTLQFLITSQWLSQEAAKRKITATDQEVKTTFDQQKKQSFPKEADYQKFLQTSGQTETDLLFRVKLSVLTNKLQQSIVKSKGTVSDAAVQDYYNKNKQRFAQPETRDLQVVLAAKKPKADAALKAIKSGTPWAKVAKQYSSDSASKSQGGRLPGVTKGQQEKTFDAAIFSAPKNKVLGPIKTQFGFYVFRVTKITAAKQQSLAQVKTTIKNLLQSQQQQKALNDFVKDWQKRSKDMTTCAKGYIVQQCKNAPKPKTNTSPASGGAPQTGAPQQVPPGAGGAPQQVPPGAGGAPQQVPPGAGGTPQPTPTPPSGP